MLITLITNAYRHYRHRRVLQRIRHTLEVFGYDVSRIPDDQLETRFREFQRLIGHEHAGMTTQQTLDKLRQLGCIAREHKTLLQGGE